MSVFDRDPCTAFLTDRDWLRRAENYDTNITVMLQALLFLASNAGFGARKDPGSFWQYKTPAWLMVLCQVVQITGSS